MNKLTDVKVTLIADANEKLPIVIDPTNAVFSTPTMIDPSVVTIDTPGERNSEVEVSLSGGQAVVTMRYNRLHLDILFANTDQPFPYSGNPDLVSYLPQLNAVALCNIQPEDIQGGQLVTTDNVNYSVDMVAVDSSLGYFGQTSLSFRLNNPTPIPEGDPNNMLTWWPLDWVLPIGAYDFGNQPTYIAWMTGGRSQMDYDHPGATIPLSTYDEKVTVDAGYSVPHVMYVNLGDPIRPGAGAVTAGVTYVEVTISINAAMLEQNLDPDREIAFYWLATGTTEMEYDEVLEDWVPNGNTRGVPELMLVGNLTVVDRNAVNAEGKIDVTVRLDFPTSFTLTEDYFSSFGFDQPQRLTDLNYQAESIINNSGDPIYDPYVAGLSLRMVSRSTDPESTGYWSHSSSSVYGPLTVARINERPGFNIID